MNRIRMLRESAGLTQRELAGKIGVSGGAMSKYENALYPLGDELLLKLSEIFDASVDFILGVSDVKERGSSKMPPALTWDALGMVHAADGLTDQERRTVMRFLREPETIALVRRYWDLNGKSRRRVAEYIALRELADQSEAEAAEDDE